jgi:ABC-type branched-subunit amino acid transport system permease subunit
MCLTCAQVTLESVRASVLHAIHSAVRAASYIAPKNSKEMMAFDRIDYLPSSEPLRTAHKGAVKSDTKTAATKVVFNHTAASNDESAQSATVKIFAARNSSGITAHLEGGSAVTPHKQRDAFLAAYIPGLAGLSERETILAQLLLRRQATSGDVFCGFPARQIRRRRRRSNAPPGSTGSAVPIVALAFIIPVGVAGLFGLFNGWFISRFQVQPIVGTLVMFIAGRGIGQVLTNGNLQSFKNPTFQFIGLGRIFGVPCQVVIMLALVAAAAWTLRSTLFGRRVLSVGRNERAARLSGVPVAAVKRWVYAISGLCAGIAGLVVVSINSSSDANLVGLGMELDAIAAVGGTPSPADKRP